MYSQRTLYYLNQIGITPWVTRNNEPRKSLILISPPNLSDKAQHLLKNIMDFIRIQKHEVVKIPMEENLNINNHQPLAIFIFGLNPNEVLNNLQVTCPVFSNLDPEALLKNPLNKKKILSDLLTISSS